ncbi:hypothetical protein [Arhodomonas sp. AD133]|uniref:hypothetical protein n=1 Tax=Arhodomonas sp. AD133 TaxID=3415009 RepID=UPI003EBDA888
MEDLQARQAIVWPLVTKERFAEITGLSFDQVRGMINRRQLPTRKVGRHRLVNLARVTRECLEGEAWE